MSLLSSRKPVEVAPGVHQLPASAPRDGGRLGRRAAAVSKRMMLAIPR